MAAVRLGLGAARHRRRSDCDGRTDHREDDVLRRRAARDGPRRLAVADAGGPSRPNKRLPFGLNGTLRPLSAISFAGSPACVVALHFVRPELDLASDRLSEYAHGPYGWLMVAAFATLGTGFGALGLALWREKRAWILRAAALTAAVASFLSGMFDTVGSSEPIHSYASTVAVLAATTLTLAYGLAPLRAASPTVDLTARCLSLGAAVMVV